MKIIPLAGLAALTLAAAASARPLTPQDLVMLSRVSSPATSPDGRWLVWQQRETDLAANKGRSDLWRLDLAAKGATPQKLAALPQANETAPAFSADGKFVYFLSDQGGSNEVWRVAVTGGAATAVTTPGHDLSGFKLSPAGDKLLVWADRRPNAPSLQQPTDKKDPNAGSGRTYDQLFVRHWDAWADGSRSQLFVLPLADGKAAGDGVAIEGGLIGDTPSKPFGGGDELSWSADGKSVFFALREAGRIESLSTNLDIFQAAADGSAPPVNLTAANRATDTLPAASPDGKWLAYVAMKRPGYESDRTVLQLRDLATGQVRAVTEDWDVSIESIDWSADSRTLYVTAHDTMDKALFRLDPNTGAHVRLTGAGTVAAVALMPKGGAVVALDTMAAPDDLWRVRGKALTRLTAVNADRLAGIDMPQATRFSYPGAGGDTVWGWALKPVGLAAGARAPVAYLVHGGPQGTWGDGWSYRWNPAIFASAGYATVMVDFHGSTSHGQAFVDAINNDWGGKPLEDLKLGLAAAGRKFAWADTANACALGASYGGYMMNWIEGNWPDGFKCIVQHDGVFDARAMAYETEELWFDEWEHGGHPYFEDPAAFEKWNPVNFVTAWKTPQLVITSEKDFRIPYTQGIAAFTALQRRDIPSRLLVFPDENHWVLKPDNSLQWHGEVLGWLAKWLTPATNATPAH